MQPGETVFRSALDKPLHQLTEDDISQVTREDCRRYLKEKGLSSLSIVVASHYFWVFCRFNPCWWWCPYKKKGMRRPSWNKSQAIQQVISLKTLLEATPETESPRRRLYIPRPPPHPPDNTPRVRFSAVKPSVFPFLILFLLNKWKVKDCFALSSSSSSFNSN
jgi:hypothetical protein